LTGAFFGNGNSRPRCSSLSSFSGVSARMNRSPLTDHVMWGTDSCLWGNPQWQIDAFRKFQIPDQLVEGYGYPKLTPEIKAKVFGQNAARIWNLKATA
jgi:predicted TIM-barrel fold metal-dependent hydrolase